MLVVIFARGRVPWRTTVLRLQLIRCTIFSLSVWAYITVYRILPLGDVTAMYYTEAIFWGVYSAFWLREPFNRRSWSLVALGFGAALLIIKPTFAAINWIYLLALIGAALNAAALPLSRQIERHDSALTVMLYVSLAGAITSVPGTWGQPLPPVSPWLFGIAFLGPVGQYCGILAVRYSDLATLAPFGYVRLPLALTAGIVVFHEVPDISSLVGAGVILISNALLAKSRKQRTEARALKALANRPAEPNPR